MTEHHKKLAISSGLTLASFVVIGLIFYMSKKPELARLNNELYYAIPIVVTICFGMAKLIAQKKELPKSKLSSSDHNLMWKLFLFISLALIFTAITVWFQAT